MNPAGLQASASAAGTVGSWALFLPPLEKVWEADPTSGAPQHLRSGQVLLFGMAALFGGLQSLIAQDPTPLIIALVVAGSVAAFYEYAFRQPPQSIV